MTINLTEGEKCQASLTVEIPAEKVKATRDGVTNQFVLHAKVPGYRPGKVPRKLIEKRYAKAIIEELEKKLSEEGMREAREKEDMHVLAVTSEEMVANVDETYTLRADLLVAPSFELPEYKGIPITLPKEEVKEEHLEKLIDRWKDQHADYAEVEDGGLEMGHYAVIDYKAKLDGEPIVNDDSPAMLRGFFERDEAWMWMDEESFLPGFVGELLDHKTGDEFDFNLTLPEDFGDEDLKGKEVTYSVVLKKIMRKDLPELTDEKVQETTREEFETVDDFRKDLTERLEEEMKQHVESLKTQNTMEYLHGLVDFDLPETMVAQETQSHVNRIVNDSQRQGMAEDALLEKEQEIVDAAGAMGRRDVKAKFILNQIATAEGLKVNDQEVLQRIQLMAAQAGMSPKKAIRILRSNGQLNSIAEEILFGKALDFVKDNASVNVDEAQNALDQMWEGNS